MLKAPFSERFTLFEKGPKLRFGTRNSQLVLNTACGLAQVLLVVATPANALAKHLRFRCRPFSCRDAPRQHVLPPSARSALYKVLDPRKPASLRDRSRSGACSRTRRLSPGRRRPEHP